MLQTAGESASPIGFGGSQTVVRWPVLVSALLVAAGYYALAVVGTALSVPPSGFAILWPATAFLISVLLLTSPRFWWLYLLAVVPVHFHLVRSFQTADVPFLVVLCQIAGNFALAIATALVSRTLIEQPLRLDSFQSLLRFVLLAGLVVPACVNALILGGHVWTGWATDFWISWRQWMLASIFPTVTIPPFMIAAFRRRLIGDANNAWKSYGELGLIALALVGVCGVLLSWDHPPSTFVEVLHLAPVPILVWASLRSGVGGTSLALLIFAGVVTVNALIGRGPFAMSSPIEDIVSLQAFLIAISIPLMLLAALVEERTQAQIALDLSEQNLLTMREQEHQRLADELHDSTVQHLTAIDLSLVRLRSASAGEEDKGQIIDDIATSVQEATKELRTFSYLLHPAQLQSDGLLATLQRYIDGFARRTHLRATFRNSGLIDELPPAHQQAVLRIVQEALANVHRHASASRVLVSVTRLGQSLHVVISDDGRGIRAFGQTDASGPLNLGVGIPGMRTRARRLGGTLHVRARTRGTTIHAVLPAKG
jgi:signal transduction histidine kinase